MISITIFCNDNDVVYSEWDMLQDTTKTQCIQWNKEQIYRMFIEHNKKHRADKQIIWSNIEKMVEFLKENFTIQELGAIQNVNE
jgi:hypothetical protein